MDKIVAVAIALVLVAGCAPLIKGPAYKTPPGFEAFVLTFGPEDALLAVDDGLAGKVGDFNTPQRPLLLPAGQHTLVAFHPEKGRCVMLIYAVSGRTRTLTCGG